ncbi:MULTISPECIES: peptidylprolyl isomerase [unclassified Flavobacterium]|uniref:peptidylprolyl isomerase n=1 Tax=unclassified Flavobacterium TaxID=196869 RepID=UPI00086914A8|nr:MULTISPECIES: peptidylprolyl isomerase [unclassified Flavobacterium]MBN9283217.1 peptidylprolyl isomerase [Flavobacterium sp.]ODS81897.1 MAG: peptidylprolyl isomerase [Chryseobacterium sp. SCN 40-13]OJV67872.1 MAG: peptidylprolyl isomerase [Flavobacterium sp. 40-81]
MKLKHVLLGLFVAANTFSYAQDKTKKVLFNIDNHPFYTDEFSRVYKKNLDLVKDESQKDLDQYLDLFLGYKLKIQKANKLGLQNEANYIAELKSYRTQLSRNYMTDTKVTKELVDEAYKRSLKEIKASHILINVDENASPADTLKAYNQALDIRKKAIAGEDFGDLAARFSQDPSAKDNKGDLGYFSVFRMVYPFETAAYKTKKGEISMPVRTRFGYHLVKVNDIRDNRGQVTVAHIMLMKAENPIEGEAVKNTIEDIYKKIKQGESFETLAQQFSQDRSSAGKGGLLQRFGSGELSSEAFENVAFSLKNSGDVSEPFQSQFGWHIVKLIEKFPVRDFADTQTEFESRVRKDDRSKLIDASLNDKLTKKYAVEKNAKLYAKAAKLVTDKFYTQEWEVPAATKELEGNLLVINKEKGITAMNFLEFVNTQQKNKWGLKPIGKVVDQLYGKFIQNQLVAYYNDNLEKENPEFANVMDEYRDGLLLFDLMEKEIWNKAKTDTLGLKAFYEKHVADYQWNPRVEANVFSSTKEEAIQQTLKFLKKKKSIDFIKEQLNKENKVSIMVKSGVFEEGSDALPKHQKLELGLSDVFKDGNYYFITQVTKKLPKGAKTFEETKGKVINDYQQYLESKWVDDLKKEFTIKVNKDVFTQVKQELQQ